jgi:dipeptidyl aminopeptidase/acylaminoacyl peptidase
MKFFSIFLFLFILFGTVETKSNLTLDIFFNYTMFPSLSLSPNGEHLLIQTRRPAWDSNSFENSLWLYKTVERRQKLITNQLFQGVKFQWSPSGKWFAFLLKNNSASNFQYLPKMNLNAERNIYLYSIESDQIKLISIGNDIPLTMTWSEDDSSLYYVAINSSKNSEWKDVIQYRSDPTCTG